MNNFNADNFRVDYRQGQYRKKSRSENKERQEVAHTLSLDIAAYVFNHYDSLEPIADIIENTSEWINKDNNMRMVLTSSNDRHRIVDGSLMAKSWTGVQQGEELTLEEIDRARRQADVVRKARMLPSSCRHFRNFYRLLKRRRGELYKIW